jgi:hypothetical protein
LVDGVFLGNCRRHLKEVKARKGKLETVALGPMTEAAKTKQNKTKKPKTNLCFVIFELDVTENLKGIEMEKTVIRFGEIFRGESVRREGT